MIARDITNPSYVGQITNKFVMPLIFMDSSENSIRMRLQNIRPLFYPMTEFIDVSVVDRI